MEDYVSDLLPGYLLVGVGLALAFIPVSIAALAGVSEHQAGVASGLLNTSQQIGGALGVAIASSVAVSHAKHLLSLGHTPASAYTSGYDLAFYVLAAFAAVGVLVALTLVRPIAAPEPEPVLDLA